MRIAVAVERYVASKDRLREQHECARARTRHAERRDVVGVRGRECVCAHRQVREPGRIVERFRIARNDAAAQRVRRRDGDLLPENAAHRKLECIDSTRQPNAGLVTDERCENRIRLQLPLHFMRIRIDIEHARDCVGDVRGNLVERRRERQTQRSVRSIVLYAQPAARSADTQCTCVCCRIAPLDAGDRAGAQEAQEVIPREGWTITDRLHDAHCSVFWVRRGGHRMNLRDAIDFLTPAIDRSCAIWADLGAGTGTFTAALAHFLDDHATIYAVDRDAQAVRELTRLQLPHNAPTIVPLVGDLADLDAIAGLPLQFDAALLANVLHYFAQPSDLLEQVRARLSERGRVVLVEYDRTSANPWVPYPIPVADVARLADTTGFTWHGVIAERPSRYQGRMYCTVLTP